MERPPTYQVNGAVIRTVRMQAGRSTSEVAEAAGISRRYLSHLENGYRKQMRPAPYVRLRTALGLEPDDTRLLDEAPNERR
ncbi:helix-turn-helix domain-containing protein [Streptomyces erythrochromogenes]|uniref:helix-turn-helix domain-containing protein n=1 Tax=Streptomyces erythrochromogenes TaxID=285574 RepID=UPI0022578D89|nr:helix-turn-helix domain-containing protein [Streptomyces erythrochromogenes]MCX5584217.1 helix-turn-helix domain-containing protein [Streptomyces erythrochromogenes]